MLRRQNHAGVFASGIDPLRVEAIEIGDVERVEDALTSGSEGQLFLVGLLCQTGIKNRDHGDTTRTKCRNQATMHRIFVEIDLDPIHRCGSGPVLPFQNFSLAVLSCQVCIELLLVGIIVCESRMNLRQRQVTSERLYNLFRNLTHVMPLSDPANGNSCPGYTRPPAAYVGASRDQAAYLGHRRHDFKYSATERMADE